MTVPEESVAIPDLEQYSSTPMFNTKAVVQQTGVPAPTLRAWERRYVLLTPERADNAYRLYSERDIVIIRWLKERTDAGMSISQAIALFHYKHSEPHVQERLAIAEQSYTSTTSIEASQPAFQVATEPLEQTEATPTGSEQEHLSIRRWPNLGSTTTQPVYLSTHDMRLIQEHLVEAFALLDEPRASMIMGSMLAIYPVEQVCMELITPTMWRIGQLWADGLLNVSVEHFASNFCRGLLTNLFHVTPSPGNGSLIIVCCAPQEPHELAALMLALFLRRSGARVVYLGQSIEIAGLMQTIRTMMPALVCVSLTIPAYLSSLIELSHQLKKMPLPRPIFAFGGQAFTCEASSIKRVSGTYLEGDLRTAVAELSNMVVQRMENKN